MKLLLINFRKVNSNILTRFVYEGYKLVKSSNTHERACRMPNTKTVTVTVILNNTNLHYELPSAGRHQSPVVQTQEMCKKQNVSYELLQVMHCTMDPSQLVPQ